MVHRPRRQRKTFAAILADAVEHPDPRSLLYVSGPHWRGPDGTVYLPYVENLAPEEAVRWLARGALVVYDACGCQGAGCQSIMWLSPDQLAALRSAPPPRLRPSKNGIATLGGWRSSNGDLLIVAVSEVTWGEAI
jgi:hypothetical protein